MSGIIGTDALNKEVDQGLVHKPVLFVVAEEHATEEQDDRLEGRRVDETALTFLGTNLNGLLT